MAKNRILGIIGGMGPLATVNFFHKLVVMTDAEKDQTHPRILIDSNPKIPDRTLAISGTGPSPAPEIIRTAENLQRMGADFLAMPCVTAHHYYDEIQAAINIPMIHMILETADKINSEFPGRQIGLLTTDGTLKAKIFNNAMPKTQFVVPDNHVQKHFIMSAIYGGKGVKSGHLKEARELILNACKILVQNGAELLISGCTEVSVILKDGDADVPVVDPVDILAEICIERLMI